jgi:type VI secretion system secreted protein VgrG
MPSRSVASTSFVAESFNFKSPHPTTASVDTNNKQGKVPDMEVYRDTGLYGYQTSAIGDELVKRRIEEIESKGKSFTGVSTCSRMQPGRYFVLSGEEYQNLFLAADKDDLTFFIVSVRHSITNNFGQDSEGAKYSNSFECIRRKIPWHPAVIAFTPISAPMTALVVGPAGQELYTDQYGRVRVQFHWDREGVYDDRSSAWIRVSSAWAGQHYGQISTPRIGQEVSVQFLNGNPDRPIITGRYYNQDNMAPWELPSQQALSGIRSKEIHGVGFNHLILDDTQNQIQAQLSSTHELSQLSLGHITRIPDTPGRKDFRGEGFELRTDAWGALRAGRGMHLSTYARKDAKSYIKDINEATEQLDRSYERHERMTGNAQDNGCQDGGKDQTAAVKALKAQNEALRGGGGEQPEIDEPHLLMASPAGIEFSTRGSTHISSEEHTMLTAGGDVAVASDGGFFASARTAIKLFAQRAGMKLLAAKGDIDVTALSDAINMLSKVKVTAKSNEINIEAKSKVVLNGGGSTVTLTAGSIVEKTGGAHLVHCSTHAITGGSGGSVSLTLKSPTERPCALKRAATGSAFAQC